MADYQLIKKVGGVIIVPEDVVEYLRDFKKAEAEFKRTKKKLTTELLKAMEENGVKKFENEYLAVTYVPETEYKAIDDLKMKKDGIYDDYTFTTSRSAYVKVTVKEPDDESPF